MTLAGAAATLGVSGTAFGVTRTGVAAGPPGAASDVPPGVPERARRAWTEAARIQARVQRPRFQDRTFDVSDFGAVGDGRADCTAAIRAAIEAANAAGGGRVLVPTGTWATGAVHLLSDVELHLADGATLAFSQDPSAYLPAVMTRYEGVELYNYSAFVYAHGQRNVAVTGSGVLDGRADASHWWDWTGGPPPNEGPDKALLLDMAAQGVPVEERVFGDGHHLRPNLVQFYDCENVLIEGITVRDSPMWNIHPVLCRNVLIRNVVIDSPHGPNNDGIDPESCSDVVIEGCRITTGDDCIAFKSGKDADGRRVGVACENAVVLDCEMADGNGGVTIGSETSGGVRNIFVRDCRMSSPRLERAVRIKSNPQRGGEITDIYFHHVDVGQAADSVVEIVLNYGNVTTGAFHPDLHGITISQLVAMQAPRALNIVGNPGHPVRDVLLHACRFERISGADDIRNVEDLVYEQVWVNGIRIDQ